MSVIDLKSGLMWVMGGVGASGVVNDIWVSTQALYEFNCTDASGDDSSTGTSGGTQFSSSLSPSADGVMTGFSSSASSSSGGVVSSLSSSSSSSSACDCDMLTPWPVSDSDSGKTTVAIAVGTCFLGLGVGMMIAFGISWFLFKHKTSSSLKSPLFDEPGSTSHTMEMSRAT